MHLVRLSVETNHEICCKEANGGSKQGNCICFFLIDSDAFLFKEECFLSSDVYGKLLFGFLECQLPLSNYGVWTLASYPELQIIFHTASKHQLHFKCLKAFYIVLSKEFSTMSEVLLPFHVW